MVWARRQPIDWWGRATAAVVLGYFVMGRSFAYLGVPQLKIFIGELMLIAFLATQPRMSLDRIYLALARPSVLHDVSWGIVLLLLYGVAEVFRGIYFGYSALSGLQSLVFNYYPAYLLLGIWVSQRDRAFLRKTIVYLAWINGIYGLLYIGFLSKVNIFLPGAQGAAVPVFGQPWGSPIVLLGLVSLNLDSRNLIPLALNAAVLLGMQVRAEWVAFLVGMTVYCVVTKRFDKVLVSGALLGLLLITGLATDLRIPGAASRGGSISTRDIVGRGLAPIDPELAAEFTPYARWNASTFEWRTNWWKAIWRDNNKGVETAALGEGYGYPLVDLVDYLRGRTYLRTPHNVFFYALGYGGWLMVGLFAFLQFAIFRLLAAAWRITGNPFGLVFWAAVMTWSLFGDSFETPYGAIPFFVLVGACIAPVLSARGAYAYSHGA
jgi:hypothetical protein